ncbi:MAG: carbohydrate ABC transporter permease [Phototrophicales bacterium]|nr:MAG: carbohydrate ABC transporter permease [Phototrophicales bacterium]RMG77067.1 MAG: carbohydrate ABC transporter permease [Chloroflexota bacterium]
MGAVGSVTLFALILVSAYLMPFAYGALTSLKTREQIVTSANGPILPVDHATFEWEGQQLQLYRVTLPDGEERELARLPESTLRMQYMLDPENPTAPPIELEIRRPQLQPVWKLNPHWENFKLVWEGQQGMVRLPRLMLNTILIAVFGVIGTVMSSLVVAYAFARFPLPFKRTIFLVLIGTIILPRQVTLVPTYALFVALGWKGTWLPLIVPHFFANAYNVFLFRQYFMTIPRELDEAAMIDGANPLQILIRVIIPQSFPVIMAVSLFHFVYAWNDYFEPLLYLQGKPELQPISIGIQNYNYIYDQQQGLLQASVLITLLVPVALFFMMQRFFMQGVVVTGVDK